MRADVPSFAYLVVLSVRGSGTNALFVDQVTLLCLWATEPRKGLADPNCPDSARGHVLGLRMSGRGVPLFFDDEGPWAPDRLPAWASSASLRLLCRWENRKQRLSAWTTGALGRQELGQKTFSVT